MVHAEATTRRVVGCMNHLVAFVYVRVLLDTVSRHACYIYVRGNVLVIVSRIIGGITGYFQCMLLQNFITR